MLIIGEVVLKTEMNFLQCASVSTRYSIVCIYRNVVSMSHATSQAVK